MSNVHSRERLARLRQIKIKGKKGKWEMHKKYSRKKFKKYINDYEMMNRLTLQLKDKSRIDFSRYSS